MRNRFGVEIKKGYWVSARHPRGGEIEGRVVSIERGGDKRITLDSGYSIVPDDVRQTLGPMTISKRGVVKQNPDTTFKNLSVGELFEFSGTAKYGMARGPWRKISARNYEHAVKGGRYTVGSVNASVNGTESRNENPIVKVNPLLPVDVSASSKFFSLYEKQTPAGHWKFVANFAEKEYAVFAAHAFAKKYKTSTFKLTDDN